MVRLFIGVKAVFLALALTLTAASEALADATCDVLFANLRGESQTAQSYLHVLWVTSYFVPDRDARFTASTQIDMRLRNGDLFGSATRRQMVYSSDPAKPPTAVSDPVSLRLRPDGQLMFNDQYGPFDPKCSHDKFAIVDSGDSIEVLTFQVRKAPLAQVTSGKEGDGPTSGGQESPAGPAPVDTVPAEARQWNVANETTVKGNVEYGLFNLRRRELNLTSQLGSTENNYLNWAGTSGGYFIFVRPNTRDHRTISEFEVVAMYNTRVKKYLTGLVNGDSRWSSNAAYEWQVQGQRGADFALYNIKARDFLVLNETAWRRNETLTFLDCAKKWSANGCVLTYRRPPAQ